MEPPILASPGAAIEQLWRADLPRLQKHVLQCIAAHLPKPNPSYRRMARLTGASKSGVEEAVHMLCESGALEKISAADPKCKARALSNRYIIHWQHLRELPPEAPQSKMAALHSEINMHRAELANIRADRDRLLLQVGRPVPVAGTGLPEITLPPESYLSRPEVLHLSQKEEPPIPDQEADLSQTQRPPVPIAQRPVPPSRQEVKTEATTRRKRQEIEGFIKTLAAREDTSQQRTLGVRLAAKRR